MGSLFAGAAREKIQAGDEKAYYRALSRGLVFQIVFVFWLPLYLLVRDFGFQTTHMWCWVVVQVNRSLRLGSYREWETGGAPWIWQEPWTLGVILFALVVFNIALVWFYRDLRRS